MNPLANLQPVNLAGTTQNALLDGFKMGDAIKKRNEAKAMQRATDAAYRGVMTGDKTGLNALAALPGGAKDAYTIGTTLNERQVRADVAAGRAPATALAAINWDDYAALDTRQREIAKKNVETVGQLALMADTPEKWDATIDQMGPDFAGYKGQFGQREAIIARAGQAKEFLDQQKPQFLTPAIDEDLVNVKDPEAVKAFYEFRRTGQPGAVVPKVAKDGNTYYQVNGKWYAKPPAAGGSVGNGTGDFQR